MTGATPGPWHVDRDGDICAADHTVIACPDYADDPHLPVEVSRANARLIAAAPAMLGALKAVVDSAAEAFDEDGEANCGDADIEAALNAAVAAIAAAEGRDQ